ncbi:MAG TPA: NAD(P)H-binding protein [Terracidiphilus sp.]|nr:NAD(P)H-binding protein [Terracidiphilus sp.]
MRILLFGATGMVGQGVLRECLQATDVETVLTIGRSASGVHHAKIREIVHADLSNYCGMEEALAGFDACFFCLGVSSAGMAEEAYTRITYGFTLAAAEMLSRVNPGMVFIYVSGMGTDSTERGRSMWARVKGRTENALLRLPLKAYLFRPGFIEPLDGIESRTPAYRILYKALAPLMPVLRRVLRSQILSTRDIGRAMLAVARQGYEKPVLEVRAIRRAAARA